MTEYPTEDCSANYPIMELEGPRWCAWIQNYLTDHSQNVTLEGTFSSASLVASGVHQATVLAPLLFLCFVNDIPETIQCKIRL